MRSFSVDPNAEFQKVENAEFQKVEPSDSLLNHFFLSRYYDEEKYDQGGEEMSWQPFDSQWTGYLDDEENSPGASSSGCMPALPT